MLTKTTSRIHSPAPVSLRDRLQAVAAAGARLHEAALRGDPMGPRELAQAVELNQQYVDILEEMETAPIDISVTVGMDGQKIKFANIDAVADWITEIMHNGK